MYIEEGTNSLKKLKVEVQGLLVDRRMVTIDFLYPAHSFKPFDMGHILGIEAGQKKSIGQSQAGNGVALIGC